MKNNAIAILAICFATGSANAANFSFMGNFSNDDEVQPFNFTVTDSEADVSLRTWSYAGGLNAMAAGIPRGGFDPVVTLFNATTGAKIAENNDSGLVQDPVSLAFFDSFLMSNLSAGSYTATLTQFASFSAGPLLTDDFSGSGVVGFGGRDSHWAFDVLNVNDATAGIPFIASGVPEPETYAMLLAGLGLLGWRLRRA